MKTKTGKTLIPRLRFPEFQNNGEWEVKRLGDIGETINGLTNKSANDFGKGSPFITYLQVYEDSMVNLDKCGLVNIELNEKQNTIHKGDILITTSSETPDEVGFASVMLNEPAQDTYLNSFCFCLRPYKNANLLPEFSRYLFRSNLYRTQINKISQGSTRFNLSKQSFLKVLLSLPSLPEQQKIASCLSSLDEVIAGERQRLELLKAHKKGLLQNLFPQEGETLPKLRFPEFKDSGEWVLIKLIDTADSKIKWSITGGPFGSNLKAEDYTKYGIRIIQLQNIGDGKFIDDYKIYTSEEKANELLSCNIYSGEIIISKMGDPVGRACIIPKHLERCIMASDGIRLVVDEKRFSKYFIYSLINSKQIREAIERNSIGSTRKRIGLDELKKIKLPIPIKLEEQQKIASCLSSLDDVIQAQQQKIELLEQHKKGLLQGLFPNVNDGDNG